MSAIYFTLYLTQALKPPKEDHSYAQTRQIEDHCNKERLHHTYCKIPTETPYANDQQYANHISYVTTRKYIAEQIKNTIPDKLKTRNLNVNKDKTEKYCIKRNGDDSWKKCKYLGSLLGTEEDITRHKTLAMSTFKQYEHLLTSNKITISVRMRLFNAYITSIFMYNLELWPLTKGHEEKIDAFHRRLLRKILKIRWPYKIQNEEVYNRTREQQWSKKIKIRRLKWIGHLMNLDEDTPAKIALEEFQ